MSLLAVIQRFRFDVNLSENRRFENSVADGCHKQGARISNCVRDLNQPCGFGVFLQ